MTRRARRKSDQSMKEEPAADGVPPFEPEAADAGGIEDVGKFVAAPEETIESGEEREPVEFAPVKLGSAGGQNGGDEPVSGPSVNGPPRWLGWLVVAAILLMMAVALALGAQRLRQDQAAVVPSPTSRPPIGSMVVTTPEQGSGLVVDGEGATMGAATEVAPTAEVATAAAFVFEVPSETEVAAAAGAAEGETIDAGAAESTMKTAPTEPPPATDTPAATSTGTATTVPTVTPFATDTATAVSTPTATPRLQATPIPTVTPTAMMPYAVATPASGRFGVSPVVGATEAPGLESVAPGDVLVAEAHTLILHVDAGELALVMEAYPAGSSFEVLEPASEVATYPVVVDGREWVRVRAVDGLVGWLLLDMVRALSSQ